ncbi:MULTISPECIES: hypothetical protein [Metabacillus]|jgi:hypothetical protein|uniref:Uncharacterized protein n=1 Tax=Metabacillus rhizolycopersici TaxID=2875709 RepID=A0ABS7UMH2_9BACI|nr:MULTISPECIES: hypothetical protein [Metabacillus]MBZ5749506.1 hypothetical protein [Metabacillus rhizolycopersici]MCM3653282.1 hypothetical protein [Metabacillus litoralis]
MEIAEYCGKTESSILTFIISFTDDIREKIAQRKLFYKEQIVRYVKKHIDFFFKAYKLKEALLKSYKHEVFNTIMFRLKNNLKEHRVFQCI